MDLGPWLVANDITVVSTVPTLVALWPPGALDDVRLLILGEACPAEIGARLATPEREVWNTYGPTEATVVACGARLTGEPPVRIGLPLDGWDLAVVDATGHRVAQGEPGELIIGGVGLARYLDADKDAAVYAAMPALGWDRAYRSGDVVRFDGTGLVFPGTRGRPGQGRRAADRARGDRQRTARAPRGEWSGGGGKPSDAGNRLLVGYVTATGDFDPRAAAEQLRRTAPAAMVPRIAVVDTLPTRTSGKIDREALPWLLPVTRPGAASDPEAELPGTVGWVAGHWAAIPGSAPTGPGEDFFDRAGKPHRRAARVEASGALPRGDRRRRLRAPGPGRPGSQPRCDERSDRAAQRVGGTRPAGDPGGPGGGDGGGARHRRPALADVDRGWCAGGADPGRGVLAARRRLGVGAARLAAPHQPDRARRAGRCRRPARPAWGRAGPPSAWGRVHLRLWLAERLVDELGATSWPPRHWSGCTPGSWDAGWGRTSTSTASRP